MGRRKRNRRAKVDRPSAPSGNAGAARATGGLSAGAAGATGGLSAGVAGATGGLSAGAAGATGGLSAGVAGATGGLSAGAAGAAASVERLRPWLLGAMCALFVARPLFPSEAVAHQGDGLPVVMLWLVLAVLWLLGAIGESRFRLRFGWTDAAVVLLIAWHTIAAVWAATHLSPRPAVNMLWEWIALGLAFLLARQLIVGRREARAVVVVMIALAVALSGYGLYQYFYELPATRAVYEADPERALREAGLAFEADSPERQLFDDRLESTEPFATFALTNSLAGYLAPWLVVLAGVAVGVGRSRQRLWIWVGVACAVLPIAACLLLTKSRSGYLATALGVPLVWLLCRERKLRLGWKLPAGIAALGTLLVAAVILSGGLDRQVLSEAGKSLGYRAQYWRSTMRMIGDHPLLGCGPGNFQNAYTAYKLPEASEEVADPHNFLLEVWATAGTPAMLGLLAALGCFLIRISQSAISNLQSPKPPHPSPLPEGEGTRDSPAHVFGGAACGFLLSLPLGLISAGTPGMTAVLLGLPLAAGCVALLAGWVDRGRLPAVLPAVGVVVLLVNLLAAGGIGFPAVAGSLWLLLALGLNIAGADAPLRRLPRLAAFAALGVAVALLLACYTSAYGPVLRCRGEIQSAQREPARAEAHLLAAAKADPLSAEPWHQLTSLAFSRWEESPGQQSSRQLREYLDRYNGVLAELAPNSSRAWLAAGEMHLKFHAITGDRAGAPKAVEACSRAVALYPNSGLCRAKLALAHRAAGDMRAFRREADLALRLDEQTPHADKKLPAELRRTLLTREGQN